MPAPQNKPAARGLLLTLLFPVLLTAGPKLDLSRMTPVPDDQPVPMLDFFRPTLMRDPKLNPSGTHIAALVSNGDDRYQLLDYEIETKKIELLGGIGDKDIYDFRWLNDRRLMFSLAVEKLYGIGVFAVETGDFSRAYPILQFSGSRFVSVPRAHRTKPLIWSYTEGSDSNGSGGVVTVNTDIRTGAIINLRAAGTGSADYGMVQDQNARNVLNRYESPRTGLVYGYECDREGELELAYTADRGVLSLLRLEKDNWAKVPVDLEEIDVLGAANHRGEVIVRGPRQENAPRPLQFLDLSNGKLGEVVFQDKAYDFTGWLYRDPASQAVVGGVYERNGPSVVWFTEEYRQLQKVLNGFFPGVVVRILGGDEAGKAFLVMTFSDRQPAIFYVVNLEKRSVGLVKNSEPWIDPKRMQPMNIMKFKTRDGRHLDAYLTLPAGTSKTKPAPLVVLPHGGPWVRDTWGFNGEVQFLASRGYAVLQPNYRGSPGYDWMFPVEDQWAFRKMHDDVTDATKAAIGSGMVDPSRVAIMGGSFGGYLAVSGVANEPDLYRCAVTLAGVFDWALHLRSKRYDQFDNPTYARLMRKLGDPNKDKEMFEEISPLRRVGNIRVPVFVAHGREDRVVDIAQSKRLVSELNRHNVVHEDLFVGGEGHGMGHLDNQMELYERIAAFLDKNLKPQAKESL